MLGTEAADPQVRVRRGLSSLRAIDGHVVCAVVALHGGGMSKEFVASRSDSARAVSSVVSKSSLTD
eukprot:1167922-Lingulodinium_polyedra.AAC.1